MMMLNGIIIQETDMMLLVILILITEVRIEHLQRKTPSCVRDKRKYVKHRQEYWEHDITEIRRAKRMRNEDHEELP